MALQLDYVYVIADPTQLLSWIWTEEPNFVFTGQFDPAIYAETKAEDFPKGWTPVTAYQDVVKNLTDYINASTTNQAEMYTILGPITLAYNNGNTTAAHDIVDASTLTSGQKADMISIII